jgi:putative transposase
MTRMPRAALEGVVHHVFARGAARQTIFRDNFDRQRYLILTARTMRKVPWSCLSYCLMGNHFHMLVEGTNDNLSRAMHRLQGLYAAEFNRRHTLAGHVFDGRFQAVPIRDDRQLWTLVSYIVHNPVKAGLCADPADWPWSSHRAILDRTPLPWLDSRRLLAYFASYGGDPGKAYSALINGARPYLDQR